jgi:hypothetical protein
MKSAHKKRGRPSPAKRAKAATGSSVENKLTVIIPLAQVLFLDRVCLAIRERTQVRAKRTKIIRALIAGLMASGLDLSSYRTEEDMAQAIKERLERPTKARPASRG